MQGPDLAMVTATDWARTGLGDGDEPGEGLGLGDGDGSGLGLGLGEGDAPGEGLASATRG